MTLSCGRSSCQAQYRGEASLRTWLHQILSHLAVDRARHHAHELSVEDVEILWRDQAYNVDAEAVVESAESGEELRDALVHLPQHYRSVIVLHDAEAGRQARSRRSSGSRFPPPSSASGAEG